MINRECEWIFIHMIYVVSLVIGHWFYVKTARTRRYKACLKRLNLADNPSQNRTIPVHIQANPNPLGENEVAHHIHNHGPVNPEI